MAEAIGLVASIFATVQIADRVISLCKRYIESIRDAPSDLQSILVKVSSMKAVLESVEFLVACDKQHPTMSKTLHGISGSVEECLKAMKSLEALFHAEAALPRGHGRSKKLKDQALVTLATLAWPLKKNKAGKLMQDLAACETTISLALGADTARLTRDTARRTTQIQEVLSESQRYEVFKWLKDIDPSSLHHRAQENYEPGTCDWTTRLPEWPGFLSGKERCLWIHGIPGAGKTVLASQLISRIEQHCEVSGSKELLSIYYYCFFGHNQDESVSLLKWILIRLCRATNTVSDHLWKLFNHGGAQSQKSLLAAIEHALEHFETVYITIDAIDESNPRADLLKVIRNLATDSRFQKLRLLLTSREYFDIEEVMVGFSTSISMKNSFLDADIRLYTESRLRKEKRIKEWPTKFQKEIVEALSQGANGMFRWVVCQIDVLRRIKMDAAKKALTMLPRTLNEAYDRIFEQIPEDDLLCVNFALKWLCFEAKLHVGQEANSDLQTLAQAVGENMESEIPDREDLFYDTEALREVCGCLITVTPSDLAAPQRFIVSFAHYTVLEYLGSKNRRTPDPFFALDKISLVLEKAEWIFKRALRVTDEECEEHQAMVKGNNLPAFDVLPNFGSYCAYTSMDIIICFDAVLSNQSALCQLAFDVLDATKSPFNLLFQIWSSRCTALDKHNDEPFKFNFPSEIFWFTIPDVEIEVLVRLLLFRCVKMARKLLGRMDLHQSFQAPLDFEYNFLYCPNDVELWWDWHFQGNLIECFAALFSAVDIEVFKLLIEVGVEAEAFDPRGLLITFAPFQEHWCNCWEWCVLEKLLSLGASPNLSGSYITPLQIAISSFDFGAVTALLDAGADPNAEGCTTALEWPEQTAHFDFNVLHGRRPLQICRQMCDGEMVEHFAQWKFMKSVGEEAQTVQSRIEAALLDFGATE